MAEREEKDAIDVDVDDGGDDDEDEDDAEKDVFARFPSYDCPVCYELMTAPVATECGHSFCRACLAHWTAQRPACPVCGRAILRLPLAHVLLRETIGARHPDRVAAAAAATTASTPSVRHLDAVDGKMPPLPPAHVLQEPLHRLDHGADYAETRDRWLAFKAANAALVEATALAAFRLDYRRVRWRLVATLLAFAAVCATLRFANIVGVVPDGPDAYRYQFAHCLMLPWPVAPFFTTHCDALDIVSDRRLSEGFWAAAAAVADWVAPHTSLWLHVAALRSLREWLHAPFAFLLFDLAVAQDLRRLWLLLHVLRWLCYKDPDAALGVVLGQLVTLPLRFVDFGPAYTLAVIVGWSALSPTLGPFVRFWWCVSAAKVSVRVSRLVA